MQAVVYHEYGSADVLELADIARPVPGDNEVLVRVRAASVNLYDWHYMTGKPVVSRVAHGLRRPHGEQLGADLAGEVDAVGRNVTRFSPGDEVFGEVNGESPGHPTLELASFSEYVAVAEDWLALKPSNVTFAEAAAVPLAATTALQGLRDYGRVEPGFEVLINGASGGVGTFAVQIAKAFGAAVTGVCSTRNVALVRSIGADHVIDYTKDDFTRVERCYDLIFDNVGNRTLVACRRPLTPKGMYLASFGRPENDWLGPLAKLLGMRIYTLIVTQDMVILNQHRNTHDIETLRELIETGEVVPVIDRTYPLSRVAEAMHYVEEGHARGKVVITV
jgi:NADPH:quinone reductase-like Zn-dependent oxidoreductase